MSDLTMTTAAASPFDSIKRTRADGSEYWSARDLMPPMGYPTWQHFEPVIDRARAAAANQGGDVETLFTVNREKGSGRPREDYHLARFAAYLVAMNGDPRKPEVAAAQAYFAIRTHEAEVAAPTAALSGTELIARAVIEAQQIIERQSQRIAELEPPARAWTVLADASGDYSLRDAAQMLSRDPDIEMGQNRLARHLRQIGWLDRRGVPYQHHVDTGRITSRARTYEHPRTGERMQADPQVRVTAKGLAWLHAHLGGTSPLDLAPTLVAVSS